MIEVEAKVKCNYDNSKFLSEKLTVKSNFPDGISLVYKDIVIRVDPEDLKSAIDRCKLNPPYWR